MCGIAGFYGPYGARELTEMTRALLHRGPDDEGLAVRAGVTSAEYVGLGHRRLSIIDLAGGHQPMWAGDAGLGIVFNGEIYNYRELRRELEGEGARFRTQCDTEVILEGWRLRGERILPALAGMFAFALWDERGAEWVLARDRWGIKPLYYAKPSARRLIFASEIKPLLPLLPRIEPDLQAIYEYLLYSWTPGPQTIFSGVRHLPPGHMARWNPERDVLVPVPYIHRSISPTRLAPREAADTLLATFDRAVAAHLVADVPVGVNLSGGLDSSAVVASMVRLRDPASIDAFTVGFGLADDETPYAVEMAHHAGVNHYARSIALEKIEQDFAAIVRTLEEPIAHPVLQTTYEAARLARERVKVVLIGEGSDELFLGYPQYQLLRSPFVNAPKTLFEKAYLAVTCLMPPPRKLKSMLMPSFREIAVFEAAVHRFDGYFRKGDVRERAQAFEIDYPLIANQLMRIDKLTMAHSLEARVPFLDNGLADFAVALPLGYKLRRGVTKAVLREAMAERLPQRILNRPKTGKGGTQALLPYLHSLVTIGPLSGLVSRESLQKRGWLNADQVLGYLAQAQNPLVRHHPIEGRRRIKFAYALTVLEQWAREYLD